MVVEVKVGRFSREEDPRWSVSRSLAGNARETVTHGAAGHDTIMVVEDCVAPRSAGRVPPQ